jgi:hypothetical protein
VIPERGLGAQFLEGVGRVLPPAPSWHAALRVFGEGAGHRVDVWSEGGSITEVLLRIDARNLDGALIGRLLACFRASGCMFRTETGATLSPDLQEFAGALRASRAWAFVQDPHGFLNALSRNDALEHED